MFSSDDRKIQEVFLDQGAEYAALHKDLSKAFNYLAHDLLIAKLHA